jgi:alkylated DNA repair dioxygenase AlkB
MPLEDPPKRPNAGLGNGDMRDLFGEPHLPEGFRYTRDVLSRVEEQDFVRRFELLPLQPFEFHGYPANRRIFTFGDSYVFAGQKPRDDATIPDYMRPLTEIASRIGGVPASAFRQIMITEYSSGAGIGWHRDRPSYGDIVGVSFSAPCTLRLRRRVGEGWERRSMLVEPRSAYLLQGPVRNVWSHSIPAVDRLRYSATLRTFRSKPVGAS